MALDILDVSIDDIPDLVLREKRNAVVSKLHFEVKAFMLTLFVSDNKEDAERVFRSVTARNTAVALYENRLGQKHVLDTNAPYFYLR